MLFTVLRWLAVLPILAGLCFGFSTILFTSRAERISAKVIPSDPYRGPPRSPQGIPIVVQFLTPDGSEHVVALPSPFMRRFKNGDTVNLLVDPGDRYSVRASYLADLWGYPLGLFLGGLGLFTVATAAIRVKPSLKSA
jgi:hypothetical protein